MPSHSTTPRAIYRPQYQKLARLPWSPSKQHNSWFIDFLLANKNRILATLVYSPSRSGRHPGIQEAQNREPK